MGVERAVTRWHILYQQVQQEIDQLQMQAKQLHAEDQQAALERQLAEAHLRLRALGPCPKPTMG